MKQRLKNQMRSGFSVRSNSNGKPEVKVENPIKNESELPTIETLFIHLIIFDFLSIKISASELNATLFAIKK